MCVVCTWYATCTACHFIDNTRHCWFILPSSHFTDIKCLSKWIKRDSRWFCCCCCLLLVVGADNSMLCYCSLYVSPTLMPPAISTAALCLGSQSMFLSLCLFHCRCAVVFHAVYFFFLSLSLYLIPDFFFIQIRCRGIFTRCSIFNRDDEYSVNVKIPHTKKERKKEKKNKMCVWCAHS